MKTLLFLFLMVTPVFAFDPVIQPVNIYAGDDWSQTIELASTPTGAALDLSGFTCQAKVKRTWYDAAALQDLGCTVSGNRMVFGMTSTVSTNLKGLNGVWDLVLIAPSGEKLTLWRSLFKINLTTR